MTSLRCTNSTIFFSVGCLFLIMFAVFCGKYYAEKRISVNFPVLMRRNGDRVSMKQRPVSPGGKNTAGSYPQKMIQTEVVYQQVNLKDGQTPAQRRKDLQDKKCHNYAPPTLPDNFKSANLKYSQGTASIFVYDSNDLISRSILSSRQWEGGYVSAMETIFNFDPTIGLIDIGCNLGVYTIVGAMRRRKVIAVDANINNIQRVKKSLLKNNVDKYVQLLHNGISDKYTTFSISSPEKGNIGHTLLAKLTNKNDSKAVKSIFLDDLLEVIDFKRAIMKIDIEGHEYEAFKKASKLFTEVDIPIVMMEWNWIGKNSNRAIPTSVIQFFTKFNYRAYASTFSDKPLDNNKFFQWPWDVVWKKVYNKDRIK